MPDASTSLKYRTLDDELIDHIAALPTREQGDWLILSPHQEFKGRWKVDSLNQGFFLDFEEQIGRYRTVSPAKLTEFLERAEDLQYHVCFEEDPVGILSAWEHLNDPPPFEINSDLPNTVNGMLPFQVQGFNFLRSTDRAGLAVWSTGTGKTVLITALTKYFLEIEQSYDVAVIVVKNNNKLDTQRKIKELGDLDSVLLESYLPEKRRQRYLDIEDRLQSGERLVLVCNYEKFREDQEFLELIFEDRRVLIHWDEMPTKLSNRTTVLYESVRDTLYEKVGKGQIKWKKKRPAELRQYDYSATPIESSPEGLLNQVRLVDPDAFPSVHKWMKRHVVTRNRFNHKPETFKDLDLMGLDLEHMTHQVDKEDPDIAAMFPKVIEDTLLVDWHPKHRAVYDKARKIAADLADRAMDNPDVKALNPLQLIGLLQMICDAPSIVQKSAENRVEFESLLAETIEDDGDIDGIIPSGSEAALLLLDDLGSELTDDHCWKLERLREIITERHPSDKHIVFTTWNEYGLPVLQRAFDSWGVSYVTYAGTDKQRQEAKDRFRNDPSIRIFLSSDAGSDSIDLPEARVVTHYNLPWNWSTLIQRQNRAHRVNSQHESVYFYILLMADSVEARKVEIISRKLGFHKSVFKGVISEEAISMRITRDEFVYMLTGEWP